MGVSYWHFEHREELMVDKELDLATIAVSTLRVTDEDVTFIHMLKSHGFEVKLVGDSRFSHGHASDVEEIELLRGVSAVVAAGERYPAGVIESLPDLRVIARFGVGYDKVDVAAATGNDVV